MSLLTDHNYHRLSLGTTRGVRAWTKENSPTRFEGMQNGNSQDGEQSGSALNPPELIPDLEMPLLGLICRHKSSLEETLASHSSCRAFAIIKMWKQSKWAPSEPWIKENAYYIYRYRAVLLRHPDE